MWHISAIVLLIVSSVLSYRPSDIRRRSDFGRYCSLSEENGLTSMSDFHGLLSKTDDALLRGLKICIITRGLPGRGKTNLVKKIANHYNNIGEFTAVMAAADDYMVDSSGSLYLVTMILNVHSVSTGSEITFHSTIQGSTVGCLRTLVMHTNPVETSLWMRWQRMSIL